METYLLQIEVDDRKLAAIFERIEKAQQEIWDCYRELQALGVVRMKNTASGN